MNDFFTNFGNYLANNTYLLFIYAIVNVILKGIALWKSARNLHKYWFIFILAVNLFSIPELLYIFYFSKHDIKLPSFLSGGRKDEAKEVKVITPHLKKK